MNSILFPNFITSCAEIGEMSCANNNNTANASTVSMGMRKRQQHKTTHSWPPAVFFAAYWMHIYSASCEFMFILLNMIWTRRHSRSCSHSWRVQQHLATASIYTLLYIHLYLIAQLNTLTEWCLNRKWGVGGHGHPRNGTMHLSQRNRGDHQGHWLLL